MKGIVAIELERPKGPRRPLAAAMSIAAMGVSMGDVLRRRQHGPHAAGRPLRQGLCRLPLRAWGPAVMRAMPVSRCGRGASLQSQQRGGAERRRRSGKRRQGAKISAWQEL